MASFVGSYSVALLMTDKLYQEGRYTKKETAVIATGFSTVSTTFMITGAKTLDMMDRWMFYFWPTLDDSVSGNFHYRPSDSVGKGP